MREEIDYDLSLQDALARDYANISAVSRMMQPRISEKLGKEVNLESIITSLKRLRGVYTAASEDIRMVIARERREREDPRLEDLGGEDAEDP